MKVKKTRRAMQIDFKHTIGILLVIIGLIGLNVYQYQNPKVVEVPSGTEEIDSTAWVQRNAYTDRGVIIDSLKKQSEALTEKLIEYGDEIAQYTQINGRLRVQVDSLEQEAEWNNVPELTEDDRSFLEKARDDAREMKALMDSGLVMQREFNALPDGMVPANEPKRFITERQFGSGLFIVTGIVEFRGNQFRQHLKLEQIRDIRLDVATTVNDDRSRVLTFVTSKDFEDLQYKSFTELRPKKRLPKFWIGMAVGVAGAALILK